MYRETIDLGGGVAVLITEDTVDIQVDRKTAFTCRPTTRQGANRIAIALKKASNRVESMGRKLPEGR